MRKSVYPHRVLLIEGRLLSFLVIAWNLFSFYFGFWIYQHNEFESKENIWYYLVFIVFVTALCSFILSYFWQLFWGKLIIMEDCIVWRCLLCRPVRILFSEMHYVERVEFREGNVMYERRRKKTDYMYLLISSSPLPKKRVDKIRSKKDLIKFLYTPEVAVALRDFVPEPWKKRFKKLMLL